MKTGTILIAAILLFGIAAVAESVPAAENAATALTIEAVFDGLSPMTNTTLAVQSFWETHRNQQVRGEGAVIEVKGGRGRAEVYLADKAHPCYRGYNIVLITANRDGAGVLKPGDTLRFDGMLYRYTAKQGRPTVITVTNGALIQAETVSGTPPEPSAAATDFARFAGMLRMEKNTEIAVKHNWTSLRYLTVTWTGRVTEVKGGRGRAEVYLAIAGSPLYQGYNVIVVTADIESAGTLAKGQLVSIQGTPSRYTQRRGNPLVITIKNGIITSK